MLVIYVNDNRRWTPTCATDVPEPLKLVRSGALRSANVISQIADLTGATDAYETFVQRAQGWPKVRPSFARLDALEHEAGAREQL